MIQKILEILLNHWTVFISMLCGFFFGIFFPEISLNLAFIGEIYLNFLQITVIPIMMTALICGFFNIFQSSESLYYLKKLAFFFLSFMFLTAVITLGLSFFFSPGANLSPSTVQMLNNELLTHSEKVLKNLNNISQSNNIIEYIENMMPTNIIRAIHERKDISILIFSILLGIALGVTKHPNVFTAIAFFDAIFLAFMKIVNLLMYALPIGIFFLISGFISNIGLQTLKELFDLIGLIYAIVLFMFFLFSFIIAKKKKTTMINSLKILKNPYLIAFGTSSSFASMPAAMLALSKDFSAHAQSVEIVMPLGVNLFKPGIMIRNITVAFFLMNLYNIPITPNALFSLFFGSWFASLAGSAGPAILSASTFSIVLSPLGIPPAVGIFLLMSIEPLIDPMISALNIQSNCAVTLLVAKQESS